MPSDSGTQNHLRHCRSSPVAHKCTRSGTTPPKHCVVHNVLFGAYAAAGLPTRGWVSALAAKLCGWFHWRPDWALSFVKSQCNQLRLYSVCSKDELLVNRNIFVGKHFRHKMSRRAAFQLSLIGRALPPATKSKCDRTLRDFYETAVEPCYTTFSNNRFDALAKYVISRVPDDEWNTPEDPGLPGCSSSYDSSRSEGGQLASFASTLTARDIKQMSFEPPAAALGLRGAPGMRTRMPFSLTASVQRYASGFTQERNVMRAVALPERGYKCRVVTCSNPRYVSAAHSLRRKLFKILRRLPQISRHARVNRYVKSHGLHLA